MATEATLVAEKRTQMGTAECRRLRRSGRVPGNVYGHKEAPVPVAVSYDAIAAVVSTGSRVVDLTLDGAHSKAMLRELQWDHLGVEIKHFDLLRIDADERIRLEVPIELKGVAPGTLAGGHIEQPARSVEVECRVFQIPNSITVRIGHLDVGGHVYAREIEMPEGVTLITSPDSLIVQVVAAKMLEPMAEAAAGGPAEPELIRKPAETKEEE